MFSFFFPVLHFSWWTYLLLLISNNTLCLLLVLLSFMSPPHSCFNMRLIFSCVSPTAPPLPCYLDSSPALAVASSLAVWFEQILISPAQLLFPLGPSCACSFCCSLLIFSLGGCVLCHKRCSHTLTSLVPLAFHFLYETFPFDFIGLAYLQVLKYSTF